MWVVLRCCPHTGEPVNAFGVYVEGRGGVNENLFEQAHVSADIKRIIVEPEDGVCDELSRAVVGDIASAIGLLQVDAELSEGAGVGEEVLGCGCTLADGDDGWVFDEDDGGWRVFR